MAKNIILASASPRRVELLKRITPDFEIYSPEIDESFHPDLSIEDNVISIARKKGEKALSFFEDKIIISADTVIYHDGRILGKPKDWGEAREFLNELQGKTHQVMTGLSVLSSHKSYTYLSISNLTFAPVTNTQIEHYLTTGEYADKAGGYAIQGDFSIYIDRIEGDYTGIMGLPLSPLRKGLVEFGVIKT